MNNSINVLNEKCDVLNTLRYRPIEFRNIDPDNLVYGYADLEKIFNKIEFKIIKQLSEFNDLINQIKKHKKFNAIEFDKLLIYTLFIDQNYALQIIKTAVNFIDNNSLMSCQAWVGWNILFNHPTFKNNR